MYIIHFSLKEERLDISGFYLYHIMGTHGPELHKSKYKNFSIITSHPEFTLQEYNQTQFESITVNKHGLQYP